MRLADFGYIPKRKLKSPKGLNKVSLPLTRMHGGIVFYEREVLFRVGRKTLRN